MQKGVGMVINLSGEDRKRLGQQLVLSVDTPWKENALYLFAIFCNERKAEGETEFSVEDFKEWLALRDFPLPRHHNSWGAITTAARKAGFIEMTGKCTAAKSPSAHARLIGVWRAV